MLRACYKILTRTGSIYLVAANNIEEALSKFRACGVSPEQAALTIREVSFAGLLIPEPEPEPEIDPIFQTAGSSPI